MNRSSDITRLFNIQDIIPMPMAIKNELDLQTFVDIMRATVELIPLDKRRLIMFELVCYVASLCELFFADKRSGEIKKEACLACLDGFNDPETISSLIEIAVKNDLIEKKTFYRRVKLYLKKKLDTPQPKNC